MDQENTQKILERNGNNRSRIIAILQDIQTNHKYLPEESLRYVSEKLDMPLIDLFSIASFYNSFSLTPIGDHLVHVCLGTACHVRGAHRVLEKVKTKLNIEPGETTDDKNFTLKTVNCLGACALGPIIEKKEKYHGNIKAQKVNAILDKYSNIKENELDTTE